jgi:hypothetical protein
MLNEYMKCVNVCDYSCIFLPHIHDNHPDHQYVVVLLKEMIKQQGYGIGLKLVFYAVWSPLHNVNAYISIDKVISDKCRCLEHFKVENALWSHIIRHASCLVILSVAKNLSSGFFSRHPDGFLAFCSE